MIVIGNVAFDKDKYDLVLIKDKSNIQLRRCWICGQLKPISDFYRDRSRKSGYDNKCKECSRRRKRNGGIYSRSNNRRG